MWQTVSVATLVVLSSLYVLWTLLLSANARLRMIGRAVRLPLPMPMKRALQKQAARTHACACDGCDKAPSKPAQATEQPVHIVRRLRR